MPVVSQTSLETLGSPPSEMSPPISSQAISVPSVALSPSGEEERPLLLLNTCQAHKSSSRDEQKMTSAHYNHGLVAHSLPPSPLFTVKNNNYQITRYHDNTAAIQTFSASPEKLPNTNNISDCSTSKTRVTNGYLPHNVEYSGDSLLISRTEERQGEDTPILTTDSSR